MENIVIELNWLWLFSQQLELKLSCLLLWEQKQVFIYWSFMNFFWEMLVLGTQGLSIFCYQSSVVDVHERAWCSSQCFACCWVFQRPKVQEYCFCKAIPKIPLRTMGDCFFFYFFFFFFPLPLIGHISPFFSDLIFRIENLNDCLFHHQNLNNQFFFPGTLLKNATKRVTFQCPWVSSIWMANNFLPWIGCLLK